MVVRVRYPIPSENGSLRNHATIKARVDEGKDTWTLKSTTHVFGLQLHMSKGILEGAGR